MSDELSPKGHSLRVFSGLTDVTKDKLRAEATIKGLETDIAARERALALKEELSQEPSITPAHVRGARAVGSVTKMMGGKSQTMEGMEELFAAHPELREAYEAGVNDVDG